MSLRIDASPGVVALGTLVEFRRAWQAPDAPSGRWLRGVVEIDQTGTAAHVPQNEDP